MAIVVQKIAIAFIVNNEVNVNETRRADTRMTSAEYDGDNPVRLANEIDAALAKYGLGNDHRMCKAIHFFEGELRLIAECLRVVLARRRSQSNGPAAQGQRPHPRRPYQEPLPRRAIAMRTAPLSFSPKCSSAWA